MVQSVHNCELIQSSVAGTRSLLEEHMTEENERIGIFCFVGVCAPRVMSVVTFKATLLKKRFYVSMAAHDVANE